MTNQIQQNGVNSAVMEPSKSPGSFREILPLYKSRTSTTTRCDKRTASFSGTSMVSYHFGKTRVHRSRSDETPFRGLCIRQVPFAKAKCPKDSATKYLIHTQLPMHVQYMSWESSYTWIWHFGTSAQQKEDQSILCQFGLSISWDSPAKGPQTSSQIMQVGLVQVKEWVLKCPCWIVIRLNFSPFQSPWVLQCTSVFGCNQLIFGKYWW